MKSGQAEITGLAIIASIVIIILIFAAASSFKDKSNYKKELTKEQLASAMADVFLRTTGRDCGSLPMSELLQDCAGNSLKITCGTLDSCAYVERQAYEIFSNSFDRWGVNYNFEAFSANKSILALSRNCGVNKKTQIYQLPSESGLLIIKSSVCD